MKVYRLLNPKLRSSCGLVWKPCLERASVRVEIKVRLMLDAVPGAQTILDPFCGSGALGGRTCPYTVQHARDTC